jgi:DNA recombination protein RmuC
MSTTGTLAEGIVQSTNAIREGVTRANNDLTALQTQAKARQDVEQKTARSVERLETIIAGTQSKGKAGENILDFVFAKLPPEWQIRNLQIRSGIVEFALRLPNDLALPIDSKWAATNLIEQYEKCDDPDEQKKLKSKIEEAVLKKAKEVEKYIDPNRTANFAIAAVPDTVFNLSGGVTLEVFQRHVVLISYSMFLPYLMLVFQTILKSSKNIDLEKLTPYLDAAQKSIQTLQEELDGRMARAITMLGNSRNEMAVNLSKLGGGLIGLQISSGAPVVVLPTPDPADSLTLAASASGTEALSSNGAED